MSDQGLSGPSLQNARNLFRAGRYDEAAALFRQYLNTHPRHFETLQALGVIYLQTGQHERAQYSFGEALKIEPRSFDALRFRGVSLMHLRRHAAALECFDRALSIRPHSVEILVNQAAALLDLNRFEEALSGFDNALRRDPDNAIVWNNRGNTFVRLRRLEEAVACYDRALALRPDLQTAEDNRFAVLLELRKITRISNTALRETFDNISPRYDTMMLEELGYRAHLHVRTLAEKVLARLSPPWRILDLGCGTGLVGEAFKDLAKGGALHGIDIAPRMIEAARARRIYDELMLADFEVLLAKPGPLYELMLSADTMIYLGDLAPTFSGVAKRLEPGGFYIFACESKDGEGWELTPVNRFRHSEAYLRAEAKRQGLIFVEHTECTLRREANEPAAGFAVALKKPSAGGTS